jgi:hypothetical protein
MRLAQAFGGARVDALRGQVGQVGGAGGRGMSAGVRLAAALAPTVRDPLRVQPEAGGSDSSSSGSRSTWWPWSPRRSAKIQIMTRRLALLIAGRFTAPAAFAGCSRSAPASYAPVAYGT